MDKYLHGKAPLRRETLVAVGLRHIGDDGVRLARLQRLAIVVAHIRQRPQRLDAQRCFAARAIACSWPLSFPSLTTSLATISLCRSSTAICTLYPATLCPFFVSNRASPSVRDNCVSPLSSSFARSALALARFSSSAVSF